MIKQMRWTTKSEWPVVKESLTTQFATRCVANAFFKAHTPTSEECVVTRRGFRQVHAVTTRKVSA